MKKIIPVLVVFASTFFAPSALAKTELKKGTLQLGKGVIAAPVSIACNNARGVVSKDSAAKSTDTGRKSLRGAGSAATM
jgi:hypothetical protein